MTDEAFAIFKRETDRIFKEVYAAGLVDLLIDDDYLRHHFNQDSDAAEFVSWFGEKFDLIRSEDFTPEMAIETILSALKK